LLIEKPDEQAQSTNIKHRTLNKRATQIEETE